MNNPRFTIYRLKIEPFMSGAPISEDVAEKVAEYRGHKTKRIFKREPENNGRA